MRHPAPPSRSGIKVTGGPEARTKFATAGAWFNLVEEQPRAPWPALGMTKGKIGFHGGKVDVRRPRVRSDGHEVQLPTWSTAQAEDWLGRWAMNLMLINVSTRKLKRAVASPSCRGSNATSVGHSPNEGERYGISEQSAGRGRRGARAPSRSSRVGRVPTRAGMIWRNKATPQHSGFVSNTYCQLENIGLSRSICSAGRPPTKTSQFHRRSLQADLFENRVRFSCGGAGVVRRRGRKCTQEVRARELKYAKECLLLWRFHARERAVFRPRSCPHFCIFLNRERARSINIEDRSRKTNPIRYLGYGSAQKNAYYFPTNLY
jgi:hypothetical protein